MTFQDLVGFFRPWWRFLRLFFLAFERLFWVALLRSRSLFSSRWQFQGSRSLTILRSVAFFLDQAHFIFLSRLFTLFLGYFFSDLFLIISFPHALFYRPKIDSRVIFLLFAELFLRFFALTFYFRRPLFYKRSG